MAYRDNELHDMQRIIAILAALPPSARRRVLQYVSDRIEMMTPFPALRKPAVEVLEEPDLLNEETA